MQISIQTATDAKSLRVYQFPSEYGALGGAWLRVCSEDFRSNKGGRALAWHTQGAGFKPQNHRKDGGERMVIRRKKEERGRKKRRGVILSPGFCISDWGYDSLTGRDKGMCWAMWDWQQ